MKKGIGVFFVLLILVMLLSLCSRQAAAQEQQKYAVFLPMVSRPPLPVCYRLDQSITLRCEGIHFTKDGRFHIFTSSTYYGYFSRATKIVDVDSGEGFLRVITAEVLPGDEQTFLAQYEEAGRYWYFIQRLKTKTKITIYD